MMMLVILYCICIYMDDGIGKADMLELEEVEGLIVGD